MRESVERGHDPVDRGERATRVGHGPERRRHRAAGHPQWATYNDRVYCDAATVMLLRVQRPRPARLHDAAQSDVGVRSRRVRVPGGAVDEEDGDTALLDRCHGLDSDRADADALGVPGALRFWVAAIRESFEEAGVLARSAGSGEPVDVDARPGVADGLDEDGVRSSGVNGASRTSCGATTWCSTPARSCPSGTGSRPSRRRGATTRGSSSRPWPGRPRVRARRRRDGGVGLGVCPVDVLAQARNGEIDLIYPTYRSVQAFVPYPTTAGAIAAVDAVWRNRAEPMREADRGQGWMLDLDVDNGDERPARGRARDHAVFTLLKMRAQAGTPTGMPSSIPSTIPSGRADVPDLTPGVPSVSSPLVRRIVAPNPGPFTGPGTNTYLVGIDEDGSSMRWEALFRHPPLSSITAAAPAILLRLSRHGAIGWRAATCRQK